MTPDEIPVAAAPTVAAPPRAVRLVSKPAQPPVAPRAPLPAMSSYSASVRLPERQQRTAVERKISGLHDATDMMLVLDTEIALQRAKRLHGGGSRQTLRVAALALFFTLFIAALAAMSYLQSHLAQRGFSRHRADAVTVTANPAPVPSAPAAATTAPAAGARR